MSARFMLGSGIFFMLLAVILGAFGAHAIRDMVSSMHMSTWQTASEYHFYHALGLIALGIWSGHRPTNKLTTVCGVFLITGIVLFSGSLYLLVLTGITSLGMITPVGGLLFILGWSSWLVSLVRSSAD